MKYEDERRLERSKRALECQMTKSILDAGCRTSDFWSISHSSSDVDSSSSRPRSGAWWLGVYASSPARADSSIANGGRRSSCSPRGDAMETARRPGMGANSNLAPLNICIGKVEINLSLFSQAFVLVCVALTKPSCGCISVIRSIVTLVREIPGRGVLVPVLVLRACPRDFARGTTQERDIRNRCSRPVDRADG